MKTSKFTDEQIAMALRQAEAGTPVGEICRKLGVSEQSFYRWKKRFGALGVSELRELRQLRDENRKLKGLVADLSLLQDDPPRGAQKKMVRPAARRALVQWAREAYQVSERRACRAVGVERSMVRYRSRRPSQQPLRTRLRELAGVRLRAGYQQLHVLLRREGWRVNHKRVYRLYTEEGLALRRRRPRRHRSAVARARLPAPTQPNEQWAMDFMHDTLADGRAVRILTVLDVYGRECVALVGAATFSGGDVARALTEASTARGLPQRITVDNGTEFTSRMLDHWAYWQHVALEFSRPGKPVDNTFIEAFNGTLRRECLSLHWFLNLEDLQQTLESWRHDYNHHRPHSSLADVPPAEFRAGGAFIPDRSRLQFTRG
jgi:putative transposase